VEETKELIIVEQSELRLGTIPADGPMALIRQASNIATELAKIIDSRQLFTNIRGKKYVRVEGWSTLGAMLGVLPCEDIVVAHEDGTYEATVSLIRVNDGAVIGRGSAICGMDEKTWADRPNYARRSMAITRATGKAYRLGFSWIMTLAGYEPTPAEEMDGVLVERPKAAPHQKPKTIKAEAEKPDAHWIEDPKVRTRFWKWTRDKLGLSDTEVHEALNVEHVKEFDGTMQMAKACILAWVDARAEGGEAEDAAKELFDVMEGSHDAL